MPGRRLNASACTVGCCELYAYVRDVSRVRHNSVVLNTIAILLSFSILLNFQIIVEMISDDTVAFARSCLQPRSVGNCNLASGVFDKMFALQSRGSRANRRAIGAQHIPEVFVCQFENAGLRPICTQ